MSMAEKPVVQNSSRRKELEFLKSELENVQRRRDLKTHDGGNSPELDNECIFITTNVGYTIVGEEFLVGGS